MSDVYFLSQMLLDLAWMEPAAPQTSSLLLFGNRIEQQIVKNVNQFASHYLRICHSQ